MARCAMIVEMGAVKRNDTRRFLTPVLQRMETKRDQGGSVAVAEDAKDTAFFVKMIVVQRIGRQLHENPNAVP